MTGTLALSPFIVMTEILPLRVWLEEHYPEPDARLKGDIKSGRFDERISRAIADRKTRVHYRRQEHADNSNWPRREDSHRYRRQPTPNKQSFEL